MATQGAGDCSRLGGLTQEGTVISNMPLLFADGFPTCLDTMTETQLERFIPFMIHCALGINPYDNGEVEVPVWWPCTIAFKFPLRKPPCFRGEGKWTKSLKSLVNRCYIYHECQFMLHFSDELVTTPTWRMKFVDLCDGTTELRDKRTSKLLVTFRNENRAYDKVPESPRRHMQLLPRTQRLEKPALFMDIYLCESCDAEFETLEQVKSHEMSCHSRNDVDEDDDSDAPVLLPETLDRQGHFLAQMGLVDRLSLEAGTLTFGPGFGHSRSPKRPVPKRLRQGSLGFSKCTSVPISSPMGRALLRHHPRPPYTISSVLAERVERHCSKPFAMKTFPTPMPAITRSRRSRSPRNEKWVHLYLFNGRQRRERYAVIDTGLDWRARRLLARCKTLRVVLRRLTELEIARHSRAEPAEFARPFDAELTLGSPTFDDCRIVEDEIPVIDLCISSDEEASEPSWTDGDSVVPISSADCQWKGPMPSVLLHQLTCPPRQSRAYRDLASEDVHVKSETPCVQRRAKGVGSGPSENRVDGIAFLGRKSSGHKLFNLLEPDSKGKLKELNKIKKSSCVAAKVNWSVKCSETR